MRISEIIARLEEIKAVEGDIPVVCHDGLSPSDVDEAMDIEVIDGATTAFVKMPRVAFIS